MDKTRKLPAAEATDVVAEATTVEEVQAATAGDDRVTVQAAAEGRVEALAARDGVLSTAEVLAPAGARVDVTDEALAQPGQPLAAGATGRVRTRWPTGRFEHDVEGVPAVTAHGVEVPTEKVDALLAAARDSNIELEEVV
jgi:hypothetical protein